MIRQQNNEGLGMLSSFLKRYSPSWSSSDEKKGSNGDGDRAVAKRHATRAVENAGRRREDEIPDSSSV
jgi:hypothetical protein